MKTITTMVIMTFTLMSFKTINEMMSSEKISRTARFTVNGEIESIFPLFGAFEERRWVCNWNPKLIYPSEEIMQVGTTFKTKGRVESEPNYFWRVVRFEPEDNEVEYLVTTMNRQWSISVKCSQEPQRKTGVEVTYSFIDFNEMGKELNVASLDRMYSKNLQDWKDAINYYLETGECLDD